MKLVKKYKLPYLVAASLAVILGFGAIASWLWWRGAIAPVAQESALETESVRFTVESGMTGQQIGNKLAEAGLIKSADAWKIWTWQQRQQDSSSGFKAGTYLLSPQSSLPAIAGKIWRGEIMQTTFTIPEGWSIAEMGEYFESLAYFSAADFIAAASEIPYQRYSWLPPNLPILEGFLYPDTYKIGSDRATNPQAVIQVMLDRFEEVALPVYQQAQTDFSLLEWVTLGSIVEKEAVIAKERALIAGVFVARLEKGMKLETDPTVEYGLGIRQTADQPLTYAQVGTPSPYNTYMNFGLPPTPIASPGIASLKATLNPESSEYLYFVARYDGTHVFSKTLAEHEAATQKIRRQWEQR
ncbi:endolytic transglycosylase MltG [Myxosarcina sp. GI1]|uniref:endolytic transglycosylase MltG n=1 Tax=Myxosarcina sp. GI1 TaxID=1541065 RepID=UPI00055CFB58|nr:endolytic transglycosylase MltG [Myxosarcina sp. GI1]